MRDLNASSQEVLAQYDASSIDALRNMIDRLKDVSQHATYHYRRCQ